MEASAALALRAMLDVVEADLEHLRSIESDFVVAHYVRENLPELHAWLRDPKAAARRVEAKRAARRVLLEVTR